MSTASVDTIAKLLDMTPRRVQQLVKEHILPKPAARGQYDIVACTVAYIRHLNGRLDGDVGDLNSEKTRLARAQAVKYERENALAQRDLISASEAVQAWGDMISAAKSKLLNMPGRIAPQVAAMKNAREVEAVIEGAVRDALSELADWNPHADEPQPEISPAPGDEGLGATEEHPG